MNAEIRTELKNWRRCLQDIVLVKDDVQRQVGLRALDAFEEHAPSTAPSDRLLKQLAAAATSSEAHVGCVGADLLNWLAVEHNAARKIIRQLICGGNEDARYWAICSAGNWQRKLPNSFAEEILRIGLNDASKMVSLSAALHAMRLEIRSLLPDMVEMRRSITNENEAYYLNLYIDLLRDGYSVEVIHPDNSVSDQKYVHEIKILADDGMLIGGQASEEEMNDRGPAKLASEIAWRYVRDKANNEADRGRADERAI